ncbi:MAG: hypothetical protein ACTSW1_06240 [Candidatus Hodarchaeales archaeon]
MEKKIFLWNYLENSKLDALVDYYYDPILECNVIENNIDSLPVVNTDIFLRTTMTITKQEKETSDKD